MAPTPVKIHPRIDTGPASAASDAGKRKIPLPIMLPTTSAVAIHIPSDLFSRGGAGSAVGT
jgi:hypothetical protein